ncbi:hypothetical protein PGTUg99_007166 [Puccinia graminis f. sp. tritici]|uniref:Uncharacterized protein n=1 Tax=Puccinia graminis f. sp. tritici TaxID=56615 RepID=A0A5B0RBL7_PUCGR|nr:hypothetical protein PGTUg99_007166 [Puccinia graminis f. sp. tritici]
MSPLYSNSTNSRHLKPYSRNTLPTNNNNNNNNSSRHPTNLLQVELGIVSGSPLNPTNNNNLTLPQPTTTTTSTQTTTTDHHQQQGKKTGLLTKCVDWLFRNPINQTKTKTTTQQQQQQQQQPQQQQQKQQPQPQQQPQQPQKQKQTIEQQPINNIHHSLFSNHPQQNNYTSLPHHHHHHHHHLKNNTNRSTTNHDWFRSQSPFVSNLPTSSESNSLYSNITISKSERRRRPNTSHATLQIPLSTNNSLSNRVFGSTIQPNSNTSYHQSSLRSLSPLRQLHSRPTTTTLSPSAQHIPQSSSSFANLARPISPNRTLNSVIGHQFDNRPNEHTQPSKLLSQKREHDQMSISPIRANSPPQSPGLFSDREAPISKRQMFWDPNLGFVTKEQREKMIREADLKLREKEGRPLPTNEAEKILEILETGRPSNSLWGNNRRANLPSISVPTPSSASSQRTSLVKHLNRPNALGNNLNAVYEEQALHSNHLTIIAPFNKKLEAERIKRLEEKKGQLRAEMKKRKLFEDTLEKQNQSVVQDPGTELNGSSHTEDDLTDQRSNGRAQRSTSIETAAEPTRRRVKSSRKIGKLTSSSSKAKVNQGRKSRSHSVNEEETNGIETPTAARSGRTTRSGRLLTVRNSDNNDPKDSSSKKSDSKRISKTLKNLRSPSPIQEEADEDHRQEENDSDNQSIQRDQPEVNQNTSCLHPTVRSSSASLQVPLSSLTKSSSASSLRPGRTFSSRRHIKAKVFSAREEDLPTLNDGEDEEADEENEKLKKIKLPSTFLSSFKLDKFNPPPPPQVVVQPEQSQSNKQNQDSEDSLFKKTGASSLDASKTSLLFAPITAQTVTPPASTDPPVASSSSTAPSIFGQSTGSGFLSAASKDGDSVQPIKTSSPLFGLGKDASATATTGDKPATSQPTTSSIDSFSRISSNVPPPNFFGATTPQPSVSDSSPPKNSDQPEKSSPFNFQPSTTSSNLLFKPPFDSSSTSPFGGPSSQNNNDSTQPSEPKSQSSPFSFGTQQSTQPTCTNDSITAAPAPSAEASNPSQSQPSSSVPTFSFGAASNQTGSVFGSQAPAPAAASASSQITPAPAPSTPFSFGAQPTTTTTQAQVSSSLPPTSSGMFDMMDSSSSSSTAAPSIFGHSAAAPSNSMPISTGFSFGSNLNTAAAKPELNFGGTSSATTPSFTFGGGSTTGATQSSGASLFGSSSAQAPPGSSSSSTPFTFGAPSSATNNNNNNSASPFVFGAANPASITPGSSTIPPTPGSAFGGLSSSNLGTPNNNSSTNIFNFGAPAQPSMANGNTGGVAGSVFGGAGGSSSGMGANTNGAGGGMFGMMNNNNQDSGSSMNTSAFSFGATASGFGKPSSGPENGQTSGGLFGGTTSGFGKSPQPGLFGNNGGGGMETSDKGLLGNQPGSAGSGMFGSGSTNNNNLFGGPAPALNGSNNGHSSMSLMDAQPGSIFGGGNNGALNPGTSGSLFGNNGAPAPAPTTSFSFSGLPSSSSSNPPSISFALGPSSSSSLTSHHHLNNGPAPPPPPSVAPGGFVFNIGSSSSSVGASKLSSGPSAADSAPVGRVTRKLPSSARKPRRN